MSWFGFGSAEPTATPPALKKSGSRSSLKKVSSQIFGSPRRSSSSFDLASDGKRSHHIPLTSTKVVADDLKWVLDNPSSTEAQTFYLTLENGIFLFVQAVYSTMGMSPSVQLTLKVYSLPGGGSKSKALNLGSGSFIMSEDRLSVDCENISIKFDAQTMGYRVLFNVGSEVNMDFTFTPETEYFKVNDGKFYFTEDPLGGFVQVEFLPRAKVTGSMSLDGVKYDLAGTGLFNHAIQNKPQCIGRWNFLNFHGKEGSVVLYEFQMPSEGYIVEIVSIGAIVKDNKLIAVTTDNRAVHSKAEYDEFSGYNPPSEITLTWNGLTLDDSKKFVKAGIVLPLTNLYAKIDVLSELPFFLRKFIQTFVTAPFMYQWGEEFTVKVNVGEDSFELAGRALVSMMKEKEGKKKSKIQPDELEASSKIEVKKRKKDASAATEEEVAVKSSPSKKQKVAKAEETPDVEIDQPTKKEKKSKKRAAVEELEAVEEVPVEDDQEKKKKKKKKNSKENSDIPADEEAPPKEAAPKKEKKSKSKEDGVDLLKLAHAAADAESNSGKKWVYAPSAELKATSKAKIDEFLETNGIAVTNGGDDFRPIMEFKHASFPETLATALATFPKPTPIQSVTWAPIFQKRDLIGIAATGSGKTLAFGIPGLLFVMNKLAEVKSGKDVTRKIRALILSPTRELASQIQDSLEVFGSRIGVRSVVLYGGANKGDQKALLKKGADVIVATPGRLMDLVAEGFVDLSEVGYFVLDEADRMLDKGFEPEIRKIAAEIKRKDLQTVMFSATWPTDVRKLSEQYLKSPVNITVGSKDLSANVSITQIVEVLEPSMKKTRLLALLRDYHKTRKNKIIIFGLYKKEVSELDGFLRSKGYKVQSLQGDLAQDKRTAAINSFKDGSCPLLIATDVAGRGIDIPDVEYVINYTYPLTTEDYCHRIGRTGRAGRKGVAHTFFTIHDKQHSGTLINVLKQAKQDVPADLLKFGTTVKKKLDPTYGAFTREIDPNVKATKIVFDDDDD
ncbi:RNA-dependent ATPase [Phlyctochytrium planicorne]|nr:RNA-dependent ATPase [Phlyctochytrium planicorne]